jgi:hypothetical protein
VLLADPRAYDLAQQATLKLVLFWIEVLREIWIALTRRASCRRYCLLLSEE